MRIKLHVSAFFSVLILGLVAGTVFFVRSSNGGNPTAAPTLQAVRFEGSYIGETRDEMISQANAIFVGEVVDISKAQWNQDSGEYWATNYFNPIAFHEVKVKVAQPLVGRFEAGQEVTITVVGGSPTGSIQTGRYAVANESAHTLQVNQRALFFVVDRELAWRGNPDSEQASRPIIRLMGMPARSYLTERADGLYHSEDPEERPISLADIIARIKQMRP